MRKSAAPSKKFTSPVSGVIKLPSANENLQENQSEVVDSATVRKTCHILNILKRNIANNTEEQPEKCEKIYEKDSTTQVNLNNKFYNVVWRKKSTKKHKTWEGDGIVEISGRIAILKDLTGTEIGRNTSIKPELIEDGYILLIGSKEVQILDLITNTNKISFKRPADENTAQTSEKTFKKSKTKSTTTCILNLSTVSRKKQRFSTNFQPLIMPQPSDEHQWNFNTNKRTVTEVSVDSCLAQVLRPHQRLGVIFLYESILGFKQTNCFGAILADEMGLGKTLQCITLIWTLLKQGPYGGVPLIKRCLIVTPSSLTGNWEKEFLSWLGRERIRVFLVNNKNKPKDYVKLNHIPILIVSYEMFVRYFDDLSQISFDLLICDEGHRLKNNCIKVSTLLNQLKCQKRIILTGTPIQNDLQEFYSLSDFVNPGILGSNLKYKKYFEEPIVASREPEADAELKQLGEERAKELNLKTRSFILRRTQDILEKYLPTKTECVIFCKISNLQRELYSATLDLWDNREIGSREIVHLNVINALKKICNHPQLLRQNNDDFAAKLLSTLPNSAQISPLDSGKFIILLDLLRNLSDLKEKIVIVSSYTQTLDLLSSVFRHHGYRFTRLDGSVPSNQRTKLVDSFNNSFSRDLIFLLSSKAGGVGLNLIGASRLVLFDSDWNPATDSQAMARVWRDGQKKSVFLYRFLISGTIEEKIYQRQISKTGLSGVVVDPTNDRSIKMSDEELKDLFNPDFQVDSTTHNLLHCDCTGDGSIPQPSENNVQDLEDRKCQLGVEKSQEKGHNLKIHQLMQWEHHRPPFRGHILKELGFLDSGDEVSYIFRNKCNL